MAKHKQNIDLNNVQVEVNPDSFRRRNVAVESLSGTTTGAFFGAVGGAYLSMISKLLNRDTYRESPEMRETERARDKALRNKDMETYSKLDEKLEDLRDAHLNEIDAKSDNRNRDTMLMASAGAAVGAIIGGLKERVNAQYKNDSVDKFEAFLTDATSQENSTTPTDQQAR